MNTLIIIFEIHKCIPHVTLTLDSTANAKTRSILSCVSLTKWLLYFKMEHGSGGSATVYENKNVKFLSWLPVQFRNVFHNFFYLFLSLFTCQSYSVHTGPPGESGLQFAFSWESWSHNRNPQLSELFLVYVPKLWNKFRLPVKHYFYLPITPLVSIIWFFFSI